VSQLTVFNRWGAIIFQSTNLEDAWDGTFKGQIAAEGVYLYELTYTGFRPNGTTFSDREYGTVTLVR